MDRTPPDNAEDWSDEEWLTWLDETDAEASTETPSSAAPPRKRSIGSQLIMSPMLALHDAIYGPRPDQIVLVVEADGQPDEPESLEVHLEPDHPEDSTVLVRPWLLRSDADGTDPAS